MRWSKSLNLASLDDVVRTLQEPSPLDFGDLELGGEIVRPATCSEWRELHARGFTAPSTMEGKSDDGARERCESLSLLQRARPSAESHMRALPWNRRLLSLLPPLIASNLDPEVFQHATHAAGEGSTYAGFDPKATARRARERESLEIQEGNGNWTIYLYPLVWGDLNADGVEDLVLSVMNADVHGPMTAVRIFVATRLSSDEPLRILEWR